MSNLLVLTFFTIYVFIDTHQQYSLILCPVTSASSNPVDSCAPLSPPDAFFTALPNFLFFFCRHGLTGGQREDAVILLPFFFLSFASFLPAAHRHAGRCWAAHFSLIFSTFTSCSEAPRRLPRIWRLSRTAPSHGEWRRIRWLTIASCGRGDGSGSWAGLAFLFLSLFSLQSAPHFRIFSFVLIPDLSSIRTKTQRLQWGQFFFFLPDF